MDSAIAATSAFRPDAIAPWMAGKPNPANNPMMEMTTRISTRVKACGFRFGKAPQEGYDMLMTTSNILPARQRKSGSAFTLVEILGVLLIIGILAGITLGGAGAVRRHAATGQAKAEIAALEAACARYQSEVGSYPSNTSADPSSRFRPADYQAAGTNLFTQLFGTNQFNRPPETKRFFEPKPSMVSSTQNPNPFFVDPWGNAYGYFSDGVNAPLIWSTANQNTQAGTNKWITSWPRN